MKWSIDFDKKNWITLVIDDRNQTGTEPKLWFKFWAGTGTEKTDFYETGTNIKQSNEC